MNCINSKKTVSTFEVATSFTLYYLFLYDSGNLDYFMVRSQNRNKV